MTTFTHESSPYCKPMTCATKGTYISANIKGGKYLILNDNTVWEIAPEDHETSSSWLGPIELTIQNSQDKNYPVYLINLNNQTKVKAKATTLQNIS